MPKTNAAGVPSWADARGTDETATNAAGETYLLDPTVTTDDDGKIVDTPGLTIEGDDAEQYESREEREQRETREREENARRRTDETLDRAEAHAHESGDFDESKPNPGTVSKNIANEKSDADKPGGAAKNVAGEPAKTSDKDAGVTTSAGTSSKASSKPLGKTTATN